MTGESLEGIWIDRTEQYRAGERKEPNPDSLFASTHRREFSPLPCCDELPAPRRLARVRAILREIEKRAEGMTVLGMKAICEQDPHDRPASRRRRTPAPRFHAVAPRVRRALEIGYHLMRIAYCQAFEDWRAGKPAEFPSGRFAPGRFVPLRL